jgi:pyridinium-3,5-bisthiocarboxylic acid mononucleotide nickel chelatase
MDTKDQKVLFVEPFSGISGDMMVAALLDLGSSFENLQAKLSSLPIKGYALTTQKCSRSGIQAVKFDVQMGHEHAHRTFADIRAMIEASALSPWVKGKSVEAFRRLAEAEGKIHGQPADKVHFHEVGAIDSIVDIVGTMIAIEPFMPARILSAPVNVGQGTLECQHGIYPVPGPAAQELLKGIPTYSNSVTGELTTPTGATLLATLVDEFGTQPALKMEATGYGAGTRQTPGNANVLRISLGAIVPNAGISPEEQVAVIDATIDDMSAQVYGYFQEKALAAGALDVYSTPIYMKKNRPAMKVTCVCAVDDVGRMSELIFCETTTIGVRYTLARRKTLRRDFVKIQTEFGAVTMKVSYLGDRPVNCVPEFEDCRRLALEKCVSLKDVQAAAIHAYKQVQS